MKTIPIRLKTGRFPLSDRGRPVFRVLRIRGTNQVPFGMWTPDKTSIEREVLWRNRHLGQYFRWEMEEQIA